MYSAYKKRKKEVAGNNKESAMYVWNFFLKPGVHPDTGTDITIFTVSLANRDFFLFFFFFFNGMFSANI